MWLSGTLGGAGAGLITFPMCTLLVYLAVKRRPWLKPADDRTGASYALLALVVLQMGVLLWARREWSALMLSGVLLMPAVFCWVWGAMGWGRAKALSFPIFFGYFALPWEAFARKSLDYTLQEISADVAAMLLRGMGQPVRYWDDVTLFTADFWVTVNETCSGMNMLVTLAMYTLVFTWVAQPSMRNRLWVLAAVPLVAMFINGVRVALIFMMGVHGGVELAMGPWHERSAFIVFLPIFWFIYVINNALSKRADRAALR